MKTTLRALTVIGLLLLAAGCKPSHRVDFTPARVSIDPGEGWNVLNIPPDPPSCSPQLISKLGIINAVMVDSDITEVNKAAEKLQAVFSNTGKAQPDSFKQEPFTTDSGLNGIHLSYTGKSSDGSANMRSHSFITQRASQCVSISYITTADVESPAVLEAIRKTLRVE
jgi:hypothetical protein